MSLTSPINIDSHIKFSRKSSLKERKSGKQEIAKKYGGYNI